MNRHIVTLTLTLLALLAFAPAAGAQEEREPYYARTYDLGVIDPTALEVQVWEACKGVKNCLVISSGSRQITIQAPPRIHAMVATMVARQSEVPRTQTFQIVLLMAGPGPGGIQQGVPAAARAALEEARQFLPFRSYELLDSALLRSDGAAGAMMSGTEGRGFRAGLNFDTIGTRDGYKLLVRQFTIDRVVTLQMPGEPPRKEHEDIISTSLTIEPGETVVVGTSKLNGGDKALVVLLTALRE